MHFLIGLCKIVHMYVFLKRSSVPFPCRGTVSLIFVDDSLIGKEIYNVHLDLFAFALMNILSRSENQNCMNQVCFYQNASQPVSYSVPDGSKAPIPVHW